MELKDKEGWDKFVKVNDDPYGSGVVRYAEQWANLMESKMRKGKKLEEIAVETSHKADTEGITGFMYGCAVSTLSQCWVNGEQLRRWHNLDTQIKDEGEKANESGSVLNPAIIIMKNK